MRQPILLIAAVMLLAVAAGQAEAGVQSETLCIEPDIEFPVPCNDDDQSHCLLADGARSVRSAIGKVNMKVIMMQPIVVRPQHGGELRTCPVVYCSQEGARPPIPAPALLY